VIKFFVKLFGGSKNARELKKLQPLVNKIAELEPTMQAKSNAELQAMTPYFKEKLKQGAGLDDILPEAFATVREAGVRMLSMRHYDVQMIGGIVLHQGKIAEMKTGEGKTLVATLPLYLNALTGRGSHLITVNDYLATRDAEWMSQIYNFLGLSVGTIYHNIEDLERQNAYRNDITYGQNNEFGFDYLRDNMKDSIELYAQQPLHYAIVDEVDSILIDEARTPLIISGPAEDSVDLYHRVNAVIPALNKDVHYSVDEKSRSSMLTDAGVDRVEKRLGIGNLYDPDNIQWLHHITQALQAYTLYKRDVNYVVEEGQVLIIDEHTGRKMPGRRWSDGLHQAVEAKENVNIEEENQTLATITFQNYFRMYDKLAGMTGTAETEAEEFYKIYKLDVMVIPTNKPIARADSDDIIYKTEKGKFKASIAEIEECHKKGQPVLVGTGSVEKSEVLAKLLTKRGIKHDILNAKQHGREAVIVAQAGRKGSVTISTNMAGRGTDIVLGGNAEIMAKAQVNPDTDPEEYAKVFADYSEKCNKEKEIVLAAGGLHILGTERHESRRIDNQLRGRSGRQGDPGSSRFYLSLEDDLLRIFGSERIQGLMERLGMSDDEPIEHRFVNKAIANAQKKVEGHNFDIRKHLLDYDDVMSQQRKTIYGMRKGVLEGRYQPELSEDDIKDGKTAEVPTTSGPWTIEKLSEKLRPRITDVIEGMYGIGKKKTDSEEGAKGDADVADEIGAEVPAAATPTEVNHRDITHELYRYYGAVVEFINEADDHKAVIAKAREEIAASLVQQRERILDLADEAIGQNIADYCPEKAHGEDWDMPGLEEALQRVFNCKIDLIGTPLDQSAIAQKAWEQVEKLVEAREEELDFFYFLYFARHFYLDEVDNQWIDHLKSMDSLRQGIGLRGYGQRDPKQEYKKEGYDMFAQTMSRIKTNVVSKLFHVQLKTEDEQTPNYKHKRRRMNLGRGQVPGEGEQEITKPKTIRRSAPRIGRNDPCPCGSGKKYKKCHMMQDQASA
jgi:preprotein translocase subunit SecA